MHSGDQIRREPQGFHDRCDCSTLSNRSSASVHGRQCVHERTRSIDDVDLIDAVSGRIGFGR